MKKKLIINFYLTYNCNLSCRYCSVYDNKNLDKEDMNFFYSDSFKKFLDMFGEYEICFEFFGGEPLLKKQFIKDFYGTYSTQFDYKITTNGLLFDPDLSFLSTIFVSVHYQSIQKLKEKVVDQIFPLEKTFFTLVLDKDHIGEYYDFCLFLKKYNLNNINILPVFGTYERENNDLNNLSTFIFETKKQGFNVNFLGYQNQKLDIEFMIDASGDVYSFTGEYIFNKKLKDMFYIGNLKGVGFPFFKKKILDQFLEINQHSVIKNAKIFSLIGSKQSIKNFILLNNFLNYFKKHN